VCLLILCAPSTRSFFRHVVLLVFFLMTAAGLVAAANVVLFYAFWELSGLLTWGIAQMASDPEEAGESLTPFKAAGAIVSFLMIFGLALLVGDRHDFLIGPDSARSAPVAEICILLAVVLKSYGLLSDSWNVRASQELNLSGATLAGAGVLTLGFYPF